MTRFLFIFAYQLTILALFSDLTPCKKTNNKLIINKNNFILCHLFA